jgi:transcriptional regulator with XRE-family HTH domain
MSKSSPSARTFGQRLREIRETRELSQSDLARLAGMQPSAIAHFEADRRKPSFDNTRALAQALKVTTDYLLGTAQATATAFRDEGKLSDADRQHIQGIIDMMLKSKKS